MAGSSPKVDSIQHDPIDVEGWYPTLKKYTFKTEFVDLTESQAKAITKAYDAYGKVANKGFEVTISKKETKKLTELAKLIDEGIEKLNCHGKPVFVRLSTRSAKDYALRATKTRKILEEELGKFPEDDEVGQVIAITRTASLCLQVSSGAEAVEFMTHSERSYQDLTRRLLLCDGGDFFMKVIIREWIDIAPELEFRGFVNESKFNALTQYYKACFVPELAAKRETMEKDIRAFWEKVSPKIHKLTKSYVVDFAWTPTKVYLVELNHWGKTASPGLFDWTKDHDVMHNGPFEMRVVTTPYTLAKALIARPLRQMVAEFNPRWTEEAIETAKQKESEPSKNKGCILM